MGKKIVITPEEARRAYMAEWKRRNPEKVKKHNQTYWAKVAVKMAAEAADNVEYKD